MIADNVDVAAEWPPVSYSALHFMAAPFPVSVCTVGGWLRACGGVGRGWGRGAAGRHWLLYAVGLSGVAAV